MRLSLDISVSTEAVQDMARRIARKGESVRQPIHHAMAVQFRQCVYDNFGAAGAFRIHTWAQLSAAYAAKVRRDYATLYVSGKLKSAIQLMANEQKGKVSINKGDCEYALAHQYGNESTNLPARPYFPIYSTGEVLGSVKVLVKKSAELALTAALRK